VFVELPCWLVDGVNENGTRTDDVGRSGNSCKCIFQERLSQPRSLFAFVNGQSCQQDDRDGMTSEALGDAGGRVLDRDAPRGNGIVANDVANQRNESARTYAVHRNGARAKRFRAIKINALDFRENIHDDGCAAHAEEFVAIDEVLGSQAIERRAELFQRGINRLGVVGIWFDQEVDILGGPWLRVKRDSITTNDQP